MKVSFYFFVFLSVFFLSGCATPTVESGKVKQQEYHSFVLGKEPVWFTDRKYMQLVEEKKNVLVEVVGSNAISVDCNRKMGVWADGKKNFLGCATWEAKKGIPVCTVFLPKIFQSVILGHEIRHCFEASFHP